MICAQRTARMKSTISLNFCGAVGLKIKPAFDGKDLAFEIPKERQESLELAGLRMKPCGASKPLDMASASY